jgi:molybdopterin-synthase adenylyltransferase
MAREMGEIERYRRQADVVGQGGQAALARARIVVAGVGGLGSAIALYSAAAGIGRIRIIDCDRVEVSNLNRQILYRTRDIGTEKVTTAAGDLRALNPEVEVEPIRTRITAENAASLVEGADLVLDGLDNFAARYALAHAAWVSGVAFVHGAVHGMYGQATTIIPGRSPCLRCIVPSPPAPGATPIIGMTTGVIGSIQATEMIKYLLGRGVPLTGRMLFWDGMRGDVATIPVAGDPACPECGDVH